MPSTQAKANEGDDSRKCGGCVRETGRCALDELQSGRMHDKKWKSAR